MYKNYRDRQHVPRRIANIIRAAVAAVADGFKVRPARGLKALRNGCDLTPQPTVPKYGWKKPKGKTLADKRGPDKARENYEDVTG